MSRTKEESTRRKVDLEILGLHLQFQTDDPEALAQAAAIVQTRLREMQASKPLAKSSHLQILLMVEQAMRILELEGQGKALLKRTDDLVNYVNNRIKEH